MELLQNIEDSDEIYKTAQVLSISQMTELIDLGIDDSNASMYYICIYEDEEFKYCILPKNSYLLSGTFCVDTRIIGKIPVFTLQDILTIFKEKYLCQDLSTNIEIDLLNNYIIFTKEDNNDGIVYHETIEGEDILDMVFNALKWLLQKHYI